jgi:hypothetical protein
MMGDQHAMQPSGADLPALGSKFREQYGRCIMPRVQHPTAELRTDFSNSSSPLCLQTYYGAYEFTLLNPGSSLPSYRVYQLHPRFETALNESRLRWHVLSIFRWIPQARYAFKGRQSTARYDTGRDWKESASTSGTHAHSQGTK